KQNLIYKRIPSIIKMRLLKAAFVIMGVALVYSQDVKAQYPKIPSDVKKASDEMLELARKQSDAAWEKALPIIDQYAKQGKPYIPWAGRPTDLPQAEIPAFPGAEGGGKYSFGGRGGRVIVVTSLEDSGP